MDGRAETIVRLIVFVVIAAAGCSSGQVDGVDAGVDSGADAGADTDTGADTGVDAGADEGGDPGATRPELWFYASHNLQVAENVTEVRGLIDRAAAAGYHGVVLADFKFNLLHTGILADWYDDNLSEVLGHAAAQGLEVLPSIFPFGYSEGILYQQPDLAEGLPVAGAAFTVAADGTLDFVPSFAGPQNGGFEAHTGDTFDSWSWQDEPGMRTIADTAVAHSGSVSARIDPGSGNARIVQRLSLTPRRQYHVSFWFKTEGLSDGYVQVTVLDADTGRSRNFNELVFDATQDWTRYDYVFNTMDSSGVNLYVGVWGDFSAGRAWFDDVAVEECALTNLIRRPGAPLVARDAGGTELVEGTDLDPVADPAIQNAFDDWHAPPVVTVPAGSRLATGDAVTIDYYAVAPVYGYQVGACLTEPPVDTWMRDNMAAVAASFPDVPGFFLGYDEMRHMNSCAACRARGLTAGELLADHVASGMSIVSAERPGARVFVWSDMFDPHHNAHDDYYMVEGDIAGSWEGIGPEIVIMNWNLRDVDSLRFFSERGHQQVIAGYYDTGDGAGSAASELAAARGLSGIRGMMYTTWRRDYTELEAYAGAARANW